jgi:hypothetical protein
MNSQALDQDWTRDFMNIKECYSLDRNFWPVTVLTELSHSYLNSKFQRILFALEVCRMKDVKGTNKNIKYIENKFIIKHNEPPICPTPISSVPLSIVLTAAVSHDIHVTLLNSANQPGKLLSPRINVSTLLILCLLLHYSLLF